MKNCDTYCRYCNKMFPSREEFIQHKKDGLCKMFDGEPVPFITKIKGVETTILTPSIKEDKKKQEAKRSIWADSYIEAGICDRCGRDCSNLKTHKANCIGHFYFTEHDGKFTCNECKRDFSKPSAVTTHYRACHEPRPFDPDKPLSGWCDRCGIYSKDLKQHAAACPGFIFFKSNSGGHECLKCNVLIKTMDGILNHFNEKHKGQVVTKVDVEKPKAVKKQCKNKAGECEICGVVFADLISHAETCPGLKHSKKVDAGYECLLCGAVMKNAQAISNHYAGVHKPKKDEPKKEETPKKSETSIDVGAIRELAKMGFVFKITKDGVIAEPRKEAPQ